MERATTRRTAPLLLALLLAGPACREEPARPAETRRFLVVVLDDAGADLIAESPTPSLDRLAAEGRAYAAAWGAPRCSCARAQLVTGKWPLRPENLVGSNIEHDDTWSLPTGPHTLPARVTAAGLTATHRGKWHLAPAGRWSHPLEVGYTHASGSEGNLGGGTSGRYHRWLKMDDGQAAVVEDYATTDTADDALADVRVGVDLVVAQFNAPHPPHHCPPEELTPRSPPCRAASSDRAKARAMLEAADRELGRLVDAALDAGYVVILLSDNNTTRRLGGTKGSLTEEALRVPWFAAGAGIAPGVSTAAVGLVDLAPTILDGLGVPYEPHAFDGRSLWGEMQGRPFEQGPVYCESFSANGGPPGDDWERVVKDGRWKLFRGPGDDADRLYDLDADPGEDVDLLAGEPTAEQQAAYRRLVALLPE